MTLSFRTAEPRDLETVIALRAEASGWLASRGSDQWQPRPAGRMSIDQVRSGIARSIGKRSCYLLLDDSAPVATITVDAFADPEFWCDEDDPEDALYVHRMVVVRSHAGQGLGERLLDWAAKLAADAGKKWLRLDAWRTNEDLHAYYQRLGFNHVRTVELPHRGSGALFQRRVGG